MPRGIGEQCGGLRMLLWASALGSIFIGACQMGRSVQVERKPKQCTADEADCEEVGAEDAATTDAVEVDAYEEFWDATVSEDAATDGPFFDAIWLDAPTIDGGTRPSNTTTP